MWTRIALLVLALLSAVVSTSATQSFGYTTSSDTKKWAISSGNGLTVTMLRATCDIVSIQYNTQELQYNAKSTHVNSGLGAVTSVITSNTNTIQITCSKPGLTQYFLFRPNETTIYMGTYHSAELPLPELRFLARLSRSTVTTGITEATLDGFTNAIEAEDIVASSANNHTRSKFYSGVSFIHDQIHGVRGPQAGVYFVMSPYAYESSSGGPFFRDINNKCGDANELTFYMNSDHTRTEAYRYGFHGPYALVFTTGDRPAASIVNFGFFQGLGLQGFVDATQRGRVAGTISDSGNVLADSTVVVGFSNDAAQYWTELAAGEKAFKSPLMKAGTYTMSVYKKQLVVATAQVTVTTSGVKTHNIAVTFTPTANVIWQIGEWDGTPYGLLNANKIHKMHPSDPRRGKWALSSSFSADTDPDSKFPMALFRGVNDPLTITFGLTPAQASAQRTLRIGVTLAQMNGRPVVKVNSKWTSPTPVTKAVATRGVTRGVITGNYIVYEYVIPASALLTGKNAIVLSVASGNTDPPQPFLSASVVFDALELA